MQLKIMAAGVAAALVSLVAHADINVGVIVSATGPAASPPSSASSTGPG
jgi:hypothetical protein